MNTSSVAAYHRQASLRRTAWLFGLATLALSLAACGRVESQAAQAAADVTVTMSTEPGSPVIGQGALIIVLASRDGTPIDGARLSVEANMLHAGMVPVPGQATDQGKAGRYRVPIQWTMGGDWFVDITVALPDGRTLTWRLPITVSGGK